MRDLALDEPAAPGHLPATARSSHLPTWARPEARVRASAASLRPGGRFAWNAFVFDPHDRRRSLDGAGTGRADLRTATISPRPTTASTSRSRRARQISLWWVVARRVGGLARRLGPRDGGALRLVRPAAVRRGEPRVRLGRPEAGDDPLRPIARIYDPWSRSVTEDVGFYVDQALASGGPVVELAVGTGRIAVPIARGRDRGDRRRLLARDARGRARGRRSGGRRSPARPPPRRPPRASGRRARAARHLPVPLAPAHGDGGRRSSERCAPRTRCSSRRAVSCSTSSLRAAEDIEETHDRWLEREPGHLRARGRGTRARARSRSPSARTAQRRPSVSTGSRRRSGCGCSTRPASRSRRSTAGSTCGRSTARRT